MLSYPLSQAQIPGKSKKDSRRAKHFQAFCKDAAEEPAPLNTLRLPVVEDEGERRPVWVGGMFDVLRNLEEDSQHEEVKEEEEVTALLKLQHTLKEKKPRVLLAPSGLEEQGGMKALSVATNVPSRAEDSVAVEEPPSLDIVPHDQSRRCSKGSLCHHQDTTKVSSQANEHKGEPHQNALVMFFRAAHQISID